MRQVLAAALRDFRNWLGFRLARLRIRANGGDHVAESASIVIANLERARKRGRA